MVLRRIMSLCLVIFSVMMLSSCAGSSQPAKPLRFTAAVEYIRMVIPALAVTNNENFEWAYADMQVSLNATEGDFESGYKQGAFRPMPPGFKVPFEMRRFMKDGKRYDMKQEPLKSVWVRVKGPDGMYEGIQQF